jgi:hypothetical protein
LPSRPSRRRLKVRVARGFSNVSAATLKVWATWIEENTGAPKQPPGRN